ncbi:hypothetical protein [Bacteroides ovatus]|uniref:hypothetical protein n=1 Tax=Bacteroides ovatus TaxID=28116 RepID=UPI0039B5ECEA
MFISWRLCLLACLFTGSPTNHPTCLYSGSFITLPIGKFTCLSFNRADNYLFYRLADLQITLLIVRMTGG